MSQQAMDVANAFLVHFFDTSKRTEECTDAFVVYGEESVARVTHSKSESSFEEFTFVGQEAIMRYNLGLPPSQLIISFFDAVVSYENTIVIHVIGTNTVDNIVFPFSRTFILVPTAQGGFYCQTDLLHYQVGTPLEATVTEVKQEAPVTVEQPQQPQQSEEIPEDKPKKIVRKKRVQKPKAPQQEEEQPQPEESQQEATIEEPVVTDVAKPVIVESTQQIEEPQPSQPQEPEKPKPTPAPQPPKPKPSSWAKLFVAPKTEEPKPAVIVAAPKEEVKKVEQKPQPQQKKEPKPSAPVFPPEQQAYITHIPQGTKHDDLFMSLVMYGDVQDLQYDAKQLVATVTFQSVADAKIAIKASPIAFNGSQYNIQSKAQQQQRGFRKA